MMSKAIQIMSANDIPMALHEDGTVWCWQQLPDDAVPKWHLMDNRPDNQINPWKAIEFALEHIDDHFDRAEFLRACTESDMTSIRVDDTGDEENGWPDFAEWVAAQ